MHLIQRHCNNHIKQTLCRQYFRQAFQITASHCISFSLFVLHSVLLSLSLILSLFLSLSLPLKRSLSLSIYVLFSFSLFFYLVLCLLPSLAVSFSNSLVLSVCLFLSLKLNHKSDIFTGEMIQFACVSYSLQFHCYLQDILPSPRDSNFNYSGMMFSLVYILSE